MSRTQSVVNMDIGGEEKEKAFELCMSLFFFFSFVGTELMNIVVRYLRSTSARSCRISRYKEEKRRRKKKKKNENARRKRMIYLTKKKTKTKAD